MKTLIYYGNENLQKTPFTVSYDGSRSASPRDVQRLPIARGDGSSVVNTRLEEKVISISGVLNVSESTEYDNLQDLIKNYTKVFADNDSHFLRIVPDYLSVIPTTATSGWAVSMDAGGLGLNSDKYQYEGGSVEFDIDSTTSTFSAATLAYTGTQLDITNYTTWNLEFWVYIPDAYYLSSIEARLGNDASNYYGYTFSTNYEGKALANGWNLLSVPVQGMASTGTVTDTEVDYFYVSLNFEAGYTTISNCLVNGVLLVNEDRVRNYEVYRQGAIDLEGNYYNNEFTRFTIDFLNFTGYGQSTHEIALSNTTGITATTTVLDLDMDGSFLPRPEFTMTLTTATGLAEIEIRNLENNEAINLVPTTVTSGDTVVFGGLDTNILKNGSLLDFEGVIPEFELGNNKVQVYIAGTSNVLTPASLDTAVAGQEHTPSLPASGVYGFDAQQYTATSSLPIVSIKINARYGSEANSPTPGSIRGYIYSDSASSPNAALATFTVPISSSLTSLSEVNITGLNISQISGTTYWLVLRNRYYYYYVDPVWGTIYFAGIEHYWGTTTTSTTYTGLSKTNSTNGTGSWAVLTKDFQFQLTQSASPSFNVDLSVNYKKLYQ